jgi:hypothetical protein
LRLNTFRIVSRSRHPASQAEDAAEGSQGLVRLTDEVREKSMPLGRRALDPNTLYQVYEFAYNDKVFYVGIGHGHIRHAKRWTHVANLVRHEAQDTLKHGKAQNLKQKANQVLAALIRAGRPEHEARIAWHGLGKQAAEAEEKLRIQAGADEGCLLANIQHNPRRDVTVDQILFTFKPPSRIGTTDARSIHPAEVQPAARRPRGSWRGTTSRASPRTSTTPRPRLAASPNGHLRIHDEAAARAHKHREIADCL